MRMIQAFTQSDRFMVALTRPMAGSQSLLMPMKAHVKRHMSKIVGDTALPRGSSNSSWNLPISVRWECKAVKLRYSLPPLAYHTKRIRMKNVDEIGNIALSVITRGFMARTLHFRKSNNKKTETASCKMHPFRKKLE